MPVKFDKYLFKNTNFITEIFILQLKQIKGFGHKFKIDLFLLQKTCGIIVGKYATSFQKIMLKEKHFNK